MQVLWFFFFPDTAPESASDWLDCFHAAHQQPMRLRYGFGMHSNKYTSKAHCEPCWLFPWCALLPNAQLAAAWKHSDKYIFHYLSTVISLLLPRNRLHQLCFNLFPVNIFTHFSQSFDHFCFLQIFCNLCIWEHIFLHITVTDFNQFNLIFTSRWSTFVNYPFFRVNLCTHFSNRFGSFLSHFYINRCSHTF